MGTTRTRWTTRTRRTTRTTRTTRSSCPTTTSTTTTTMPSCLCHTMRTSMPTRLLPTEEALNCDNSIQLKKRACNGWNNYSNKELEELEDWKYELASETMANTTDYFYNVILSNCDL